MRHQGRGSKPLKKLPLDHDAFQCKKLAGMQLWACSYTENGVLYAISLYGTSEKQILEDNCDQIENLVVDGRMVSVIPEFDADGWKIIAKYEKANKKQC